MHEETITDLTAVKTRRSLGKQLGLKSGDALIVIDMQRDFFANGSLAVTGAEDIIEPVNAYLAAFEERELPIFLTRDWHPPQHCSFKTSGGVWPAHCVKDTPGAQWAKALRVPPSARVISKGIEPAIEAYSAFAGTQLLHLLQEAQIRRVFVAGVATDYCVHATVLGARSHGLDVVVLGDAIRGVNRQHGDESRALREMLECGATFFERSHGATRNAHPAPSARRMMYAIGAYGFGIETTVPFAQCIERVIQALQNEGFGVLTDIDVAATMNRKLDVTMAPYRILGACNPALAHRAIGAQPSIGLLLPCNVVVRQDETRGTVRVEFMDPNVLSELVDDEEIAEVAHQVRRKLRQAINWI